LEGKILRNKKSNASFGFHFSGERVNRLAGISNIGWEKRTSTSYYWDGMKRKDVGRCAFQYTLSGQGILEYGTKTYHLQAGQAFFVHFPSDHRYFLPESSPSWEFIYISLHGKEVLHYYEKILDKAGPCFALPFDALRVKMLYAVCERAVRKQLQDGYRVSGLAYQFILELYRYVHEMDKPHSEWPAAVIRATVYMLQHYEEDVTLDDLVAESKLSKYHFTHLFRKTTMMTPIQYLTKLRVEKAMEKLKNTDDPIHDIAVSCGFASGNYFAKVFKKTVGYTPGEFRHGSETMPVDVMVFD
jgi:AraC-like DNA-binding protein